MRKLLILAAMIAAATPAQAVWRVARSAHFVIYSEDKPEVLRTYATELERFDAAMRVLRKLPNGTDSPNNKLTIFQLSTIGAVQKVSGTKSRTLAGFYNGRAGGSVAFVPRRTQVSSKLDLSAETVLLHEYAHHFMFRNFSFATPLWFSEGFAEFNSTARFIEDGSVDLGMPAHHRAGGLFFLAALPIERLVEVGPGERSAEALESLYSRGWLLTHFLYFSPEREGQLATYLARLNDGKKSLDAAREAFGDLDKLDHELTAYMKQRRFNYMRVPATKIAVAPVEVEELSPGGQALMSVHMRSERGVDEKEAAKLVVEARQAAAPYPDDVFAQLVLAEAEIDANNLDACEQAADRVLARDPANFQAMLYKGRVATERLSAASSQDAEAWKLARRWFVKANRADPNAPEPLIRFYHSFKAEGAEPTANAVVGLQTAAALAPEDDMLRLQLAIQYLADKKGPEARAALVPAAYNPHGGPLAEAASRVIAALDKGGAEAALKAWSDAPEKAESAPAPDQSVRSRRNSSIFRSRP